MKRLIVPPVLLLAAVAFAATGLADPGHKNKQPHPNKATVVIQTTDNGCAGNSWAVDILKRTVKAHRNKDGSYRVRLEDKGTFVTNAGTSPGNCPENKSRHGLTVLQGVQGTVKGYITGTVTNGTFDPNKTCTAVPCTKAVFIAAFFGPGAQFSCQTSSKDCKFKYDYHAKNDKQLLFRHWQDSGTGAGTFLKEKFKGDIANA